jgi:hypothetical protein
MGKAKRKQHNKNADEYSRYSDVAYGSTKERKKKMQELGISDAKYLKQHSDRHTAVFEKNGKIIVAARGTEIKRGWRDRLEDLGSDLLVGMGMQQLGTRYKNLKSQTDALAEQYGKDNIIMTGHSLGGTLADSVAKASGYEAHVFNPGSSPAQMAAGSKMGAFKQRQTHDVHTYHATGDVISTSSKGSMRTRQNLHQFDKKKGIGAHSLENFRLL